MDALYFGTMLIGVAWLAVWTVAPADWRARYWWPFDMARHDEPGETSPREPPAGRRGRRDAAARPAPVPPPAQRRPPSAGWRNRPAPTRRGGRDDPR
jgi:hypothetical protein